jgi:hypothetical protein
MLTSRTWTALYMLEEPRLAKELFMAEFVLQYERVLSLL